MSEPDPAPGPSSKIARWIEVSGIINCATISQATFRVSFGNTWFTNFFQAGH